MIYPYFTKSLNFLIICSIFLYRISIYIYILYIKNPKLFIWCILRTYTNVPYVFITCIIAGHFRWNVSKAGLYVNNIVLNLHVNEYRWDIGTLLLQKTYPFLQEYTKYYIYYIN